MNKFSRLIPILAVAIALLIVASPFTHKAEDSPYNYDAFGKIPVSAGGRTKPLDSVARNSLMIVSDRQTAEINDRRVPAIHWLLDVMAQRPEAENAQVFRIDHPDVRGLLGETPDKQKRFSFRRIVQNAQTINQQAEMVRNVDAKERTVYQRHLLELLDHLNTYSSLWHGLTPYMLPPLSPDKQWRPLAMEIPAHEGHGEPTEEAKRVSNILTAYQTQDPQKFNQAVAEYTLMLDTALPDVMSKARFEVIFNRLQPFYQGTVLYVLVFLLCAGALLLAGSKNSSLGKALGQSAIIVAALTFLLHSFGLGARVYLQGYAPVTNLYSSAVFIGWFCVGMGLFMEWLFKNNLGTLIAAVIGFTTLIIAHNLADGDTMQMMQAVLDSNFWLSTHVTTVTIGYSATFMAGLLAVLYILAGVYTTALDKQLAKTLGKMIYGTIAFALLFSFVGTVLGGIWADQSWGRFWGWDPKENGAVLIVLMNALILHARWAGMIKMRGVAVLAVLGNVVTAWSWFGTNMLGVGLHSYGFMDKALIWMLVFIGSQVAIMSAGLIPLNKWKSFREKPTAA